MSKPIKSIIIVGGGTAGWLTAAVLSCRLKHRIERNELKITLCESPDIPIVGVGEGTWPTMRNTLKEVGISEAEFIEACDVSFKQGSKFVNWKNDVAPSAYYHPFDNPPFGVEGYLAEYSISNNMTESLASAFTAQEALCESGKSPKTVSTAEYTGVVNYGYHLNASAFSTFLANHCTKKLAVNHVLANVVSVIQDETNGISAIELDNGEQLEGDFFVDCTGFKSLLLGSSLGVPLKPVDDVLFTDTALAAQVEYATDSDSILSYTKSTATDAGWIWDISLPNRRGVGHVFSSKYMNIDKAKSELIDYIHSTGGNTESLQIREINFQSGYREKFWHKNCVAIGLSSGFLEPLEASALILVELGAKKVAEQLPQTSAGIELAEQRYNNKLHQHWQRTIEFLKLHYVLSDRQSDFWKDNRADVSIPQRLRQSLEAWKYEVPRYAEFDPAGEMFTSINYQFVLYGSGFKTNVQYSLDENITTAIEKQQRMTQMQTSEMLNVLPSTRESLRNIKQFGIPKI